MTTIYVDHSNDAQILVRGEDRHRFLQGMCMSDVAAMKSGEWLRTAMLSPKGRVLAIFEVVAEDEALHLLCDGAFGEKLFQALDDHIIADDVELQHHQSSAHRVIDGHESFWSSPCVFTASPGLSALEAEVECKRIEAGFVRYGVDVSEKEFPFESGLARYIDYKKGCYVGQEPVARVFYKGAPQRIFRGLIVDDAHECERGAAISHPERSNAGLVTSACVSPTYGSIALAYLHKSVAEAGTTLDIEGKKAVVRELPFG